MNNTQSVLMGTFRSITFNGLIDHVIYCLATRTITLSKWMLHMWTFWPNLYIWQNKLMYTFSGKDWPGRCCVPLVIQSTHISVSSESHSGFRRGQKWVKPRTCLVVDSLRTLWQRSCVCLTSTNSWNLTSPTWTSAALTWDTETPSSTWGGGPPSLHLVLPVIYLSCLAISIRPIKIYKMDVKHMKHTNIPLYVSF